MIDAAALLMFKFEGQSLLLCGRVFLAFMKIAGLEQSLGQTIGAACPERKI